MIIIIMGVSGSGKTTVGRLLAKELEWPFYDADDFHPKPNIEKMKAGIPLTDADRSPWLAKLAGLLHDLDQQFQSAVLACSALRQAYRETLGRNVKNVRFVYLKGSYEPIRQRMQERQEHFMKEDLLKSQFDILEEPAPATIIDAREEPARIVQSIRRTLHL